MKVYLQDSIWVDNFPTLVVVFVCVGLLHECAQVGETHYGRLVITSR